MLIIAICFGILTFSSFAAIITSAVYSKIQKKKDKKPEEALIKHIGLITFFAAICVLAIPLLIIFLFTVYFTSIP